MIINDFMINLHKTIIDNGNEQTSATLYIKNLYSLNHNKPFTSLAFLKKTDNILSILSKYALSTQRGIIGSILGVIKYFTNKNGYKKLQDKYTDILKQLNDDKPDANTKSEKENNNWITWEEVQDVKDELFNKIKDLGKKISVKQYNNVLQFFLLSLYTDIPPRRNKDYLEMFIVKKYNDKMNNDFNYLSIDDNRLVFNSYKTSKTYGQQIINYDDNEELKKAISIYLKYHPLIKGKFSKSKTIPLLVSFSGSPLNQINSITRILNKVFNKKIGSSMLRHIYLTGKYGEDLKEKNDDAEAMGHSINTQKEYIKTD